MNEGLSFAMVFDTSEFDKGIQKIEEQIRSVSSNVETESERIKSLFTDIPKIDIHAVTNMPETADQIGEAYAEIARVTRINEQAIAELDAQYNQLTEDINKFQNIPEKRDDVKKWREEKVAIKQNIDLRRDMVAKVQELTKVVEQNEKAFDKQAKTQNNVKARIREVMAEMAALRNEAQMNGQTIDESTGRYRQLAEELGRLKDIQGDVATQAKILSNDENQFQGIISGLTGLSGGFSAAQGAMALFGAENEDLQKVMTQLQAVMAITIGLQQVQQMLNKDSAFRLVTLNSLRSLWNKLMGESNAATATENASKATNISLTETQTAAEEANTIAEEANSVARMANNKAIQVGSEGKIADAISTKTATQVTNAATVAQNTHTASVKAGTLATKGLTLATKLLKLALISTGIGALIWGVGELVAWITKLNDKENEAKKRTEELNKIHSSGYEVYVKEKLALEDTIKSLDSFNGSKEQEKKKVQELNSKYGESLGYYNSVAEWQRVLAEKGKYYLEYMKKKAVAQAALNKYTEDYVKLLELNHKTETNQKWTKEEKEWFDNNFFKTAEGKLRLHSQEIYESVTKDMDSYAQDHELDKIHIDPNSKNPKGNTKQFDPKEAAWKRAEAEKQYAEELKQHIKQANDEITQANIDAMQEGLAKELKAIDKRTEDLTDHWKQSFLKIAKARQEEEKAIYLNQKGHTLEGWEKSDRGKMTAQDYLNEMLADPKNAEFTNQYYDRQTQITEQREKQIAAIKQSFQDKLIEQYGTTQEKEELLTRQWMERMNKIRNDLLAANWDNEAIDKFMQEVYKAMDKDFDELGLSQLKKSINWEEVFGNMDSLATSSLESLKEKLQVTLKTVSSPEAAKTITDAIKNIDKELAERNHFENLKNSLTSLVTANKQVQTAQEAYNKALEKGNTLEIKAAEETLNAAKNTKQKALAEATSAIQASVSKVGEYLNIANTLTNTLGELGMEIPEQLTGFMDGMGQVLEGLSQINLTNPISIITGGITAIGGMIKGIGSLFNNDSQHQKNIEALQTRIDNLQKSYDKLDKAVGDFYSKDASKMIEQQNTLLKQQKTLIQNQIREEQSKKNSDDTKIKEWREQIESINELIEENKKAAIDAIFGEDLKSAIENFADAYAEAWANNEDRAQSAKDTVKKMMQQMVQESIKAAIQSSGKMEEIRQKLQEFYADNVLTGWEQDYVYKMAESLQEQIDQQFGWASSLFEGDTERTGTVKGIATASQDSVDENNARLATIQGHTYTLVQGLQELNGTANAILIRVSGIEENTNKTNNKLEEIDRKTKRVVDAIENIETSGIRLKN